MEQKNILPIKAYHNQGFLNSSDGRIIRILCEYIEPQNRFNRFNVKDTIVFFGSARSLSKETATENLEKIEHQIQQTKAPSSELKEGYEKAKRDLIISRYYEDARALAEKLTHWSKNLDNGDRRFIIASGGGPGIMEAANRGASEARGMSAGLNISLPFEQFPNPYISRELSFEFHYFFIRKFWFVYLAKALVVFPGGFGTIDEIFELLTLIQTKKVKKPMPTVIYGPEYWNEIVNFEGLVKWGMISPEDLDLFKFCDNVDQAFEYLTTELTNYYLKD